MGFEQVKKASDQFMLVFRIEREAHKELSVVFSDEPITSVKLQVALTRAIYLSIDNFKLRTKFDGSIYQKLYSTYIFELSKKTGIRHYKYLSLQDRLNFLEYLIEHYTGINNAVKAVIKAVLNFAISELKTRRDLHKYASNNNNFNKAKQLI